MTNTLVKKDFAEVGFANNVTNDDVSTGAGNVKDSIKIYYEIHGNGPNKILFVMGLNATSGSWEYQIIKYVFLIIVVLDGQQMACDVVELLNKIEWTSDVNLVGVSMGGMISQELVLLKPHYFKSLCLTSSTPGLTIPPINGMLMFMKLMAIKNPIAKSQLAVDVLFPENWLKSPPSIESSHNTNRDHVIESLIRRINNTRIQPVRGAIGQISACLRHYVSSERLQIIRDKIPQW
ncbi:1057_t:CDS:10 [Entrophospora sp. SA101]|nr:6902_t:CDS:10 [Entrophospora sp. SA101]CAJ0910030.1 1057_t:CDS:10 [Entrophospora sp. SA101]